MKLLRNLFVSFVALLALLVLAGCATDSGLTADGAQPTTGLSPAPEDGPTKSDVIRPQELLTIEMLDIGPGIQKIEQIVADDGTITLPLMSERVHVAGKKVSELQDAIRDLYVPKYYKRMTVNIKRENRYYFVSGQVKNPSQRAYTGDITLTRAIASAGDFTDYADKKNIEIMRSNGVKQKVNWKNALKNPKKYDLPIYPGDTVHVPLRLY
jgi:protein involved in polysaccharide export with SLBB domain